VLVNKLELENALTAGRDMVLEVPASQEGWRSWWRVVPHEGGSKYGLLHYEFDSSYIAEDRWVGPNDGEVILAEETLPDIPSLLARLSTIAPLDQVDYVWNTDFPA
jgi:hypothetical protein